MQEGSTGTSFLERLNELERHVRTQSRMPMSRSILVDQDELLDLVDQLRMTLLEDVRRAQQSLRRRDETLAEAQREAETLRGEARARAEQMLVPTSMDRRVRERVEALDLAARRQADTLYREADDYAAAVLTRLERELEKLALMAAGAREQIELPVRSDGRLATAAQAPGRDVL